MKKLLLALAVVGATLFTACNKDQNCGHEFIEYDNTKNLVGTWTYLEEGQAEAMVINPDGSFAVTGVMNGGNGSLYEEKGTIKVVNNKVSLVFEGDKDVIEGRLELVAGKSMSIVLNEEYDVRLTYNYCEKDLSKEIVGMWVSMDKAFGNEEESVIIFTYDENGKTYFTGFAPEIDGYFTQAESNYKIIGDLKISSVKGDSNMPTKYMVNRINIIPNGTEYGDIMTTHDMTYGTTPTFLRIKQTLNLTGKVYDYISAYVTNVKGKDEDFTILGHTFNMANIDGGNFDMLFRSELFCVGLNANSIKQYYRYNGRDIEIEIPITVDGNKVTLDMSAEHSAYRKVDMYMFQDADDSQLHMYMPTASFINYFANMELYNLLSAGKIETTDTTAIEKVFTDMEARIESINVSFVMKARN